MHYPISVRYIVQATSREACNAVIQERDFFLLFLLAFLLEKTCFRLAVRSFARSRPTHLPTARRCSESQAYQMVDTAVLVARAKRTSPDATGTANERGGNGQMGDGKGSRGVRAGRAESSGEDGWVERRAVR